MQHKIYLSDLFALERFADLPSGPYPKEVDYGYLAHVHLEQALVML